MKFASPETPDTKKYKKKKWADQPPHKKAVSAFICLIMGAVFLIVAAANGCASYQKYIADKSAYFARAELINVSKERSSDSTTYHIEFRYKNPGMGWIQTKIKTSASKYRRLNQYPDRFGVKIAEAHVHPHLAKASKFFKLEGTTNENWGYSIQDGSQYTKADAVMPLLIWALVGLVLSIAGIWMLISAFKPKEGRASEGRFETHN